MATKFFVARAKKVANIWTATPANPEIGDIYALKVNNVTVAEHTVTTATVDAVVAALVAAWTASRTGTAAVPEVANIAASAGVDGSGNTAVVLTHQLPGVPFEVTGTTTDAGDFDPDVAVIQEGSAGQNEIQRITLAVGATGGTFTLTFQGQTTGNIAFDAPATGVGSVQTSLEALSNIASGDVAVTGDAGGPWTVEFLQAYANTNVALITGDGTNLTGGHSVSVATTVQGSVGVNEVQRIDATDLTGTTFTVSFTNPFGVSATSAGIFRGATASQVQTALEAMASIGAGNVMVTLVESGLTGNSWDVEFIDTLGNQNVNAMTSTSSGLVITTQTAGSATGVDEVQVISLQGNPTGGTFTLTFEGQTTGNIAFDATAADVHTALEALSNITAADLTESGGPLPTTPVTISFGGTVGSSDRAQMTGTGTNLTGGGVNVVTTQEATDAANEIQQVTLPDGVSGGTFTLANDYGAGTETTAGIAYNASAATVQTALIALTTPDAGDFVVSGDDGGPWLIEFADDLAATNFAAFTPDGANLTGSGTQSLTVAELTAATGPNHADNAVNWHNPAAPTTPTIPANGDTAVFDESAGGSCLYGLDGLSAVTLAVLHVKAGFRWEIGLKAHTGTYYEYLDQYLQVGATLCYIGEGEGNGSKRVKIDFGAVATTVQVSGTAKPESGAVPSVFLIGTSASNVVRVTKGNVGLAVYPGEVFDASGGLHIGYETNRERDAEVFLGAGVTIATVSMNGGIVEANSAIGTSWTQTGGTSRINGTGAVAQLTLRGEARCYYNTTGTLGGNTVLADSALLSLDEDSRAKTITNPIEIYSDDAEFWNETQVVAPVLDFNNCGADLSNIHLGSNRRLTVAAPS